jgi:30S ribosomal protein 3
MYQACCSGCRDKVLLLNRTTEVINFWQSEGEKHTLAEAQEQFPDCTFMGA